MERARRSDPGLRRGAPRRSTPIGVRGFRRVGPRTPLPPRGARRRGPGRRGLRPFLLRLLRGRGPVVAAGARGVSVRLRPRREGLARGVADRPPRSFPTGSLDVAKPMAHVISQLRFRFSCARDRVSSPRGPGPLPRFRLEGLDPSSRGLAESSLARVAVPAGGDTADGMALTHEERPRGLSLLRPGKRAAAGGDAETAVRGITLIVVSWKDAEDLAGCLESLSAARRRAAAGGPELSLIVVDNGGHLSEPGPVRSLWPGVRWIVNEANRGLGPAANQAAEAATGDVLLFMNPDTRAEGEPYSEIARAFAGRPEVVAVAPRLIDTTAPSNGASRRLAPPDREDQFTFQLRRLPTLGSDARQLLLFDHLFPNNARRRRDRYADE